MGININNFSKDNNSVETVENLPTTIQEENFDIMEYTNNKKNELRKSKEVEALTSLIEVENPDTILQFGRKASEGVARVSDSLLNTIKLNRNEENSKMLVHLTKIMDKFDLDDFQETKEPNFVQKLFKKANNAIEMMFQKYETLGGEVEKIQIELEQYERDIALSNKQIGAMLNENFDFYNELQKYIVAGEMAVEEMDNEILPYFKQKSETSGDQMDIVNYQELLKVYDMLNQRVYDLRIAENIAIQTIPMLRGMQHNNYGLIRKINSAFVVTLPVFKQCLSQAILLKKQELQAKSLKALDDKTNELLLRNAQNVSSQSAQIARMAGTSSVQIETLEKMYNTIKSGIDETMRIEENNRVTIKDNTKRLEELNTAIIYNK
ncbi:MULTISPECIES: toxic anion resistance protein [unclassified Clostridioides]|uniref:toxic anion resistance protein n=1 Tax=unclassified Clostridioides TaxID=2635829 RepID=UPI001D0C4A9D|nr:toxic anion resistance protein [Clostridioides sp. ES-S-0001-02]MCC0640065.1 toxic anion resistance protein [Clostridioides sp. ES-S-0049-03]MCC0652160.1 toxic anion resistance protein [Clostridioides sp. ES-S-0001-03]MCC0655503.1 toxic anion resistance protein [Clostridioides sp. ES-S-0123-01]MCC0670655.1 toxic anion resistance protein [Clostridioides sp. ES-S-0145-01]MCC0674713.1 toxic anion resistance protein [Clostridioides sp. ES-W-0018-02]MCC0679242.1 toxic anion resistance protein [